MKANVKKTVKKPIFILTLTVVILLSLVTITAAVVLFSLNTIMGTKIENGSIQGTIEGGVVKYTEFEINSAPQSFTFTHPGQSLTLDLELKNYTAGFFNYYYTLTKNGQNSDELAAAVLVYYDGAFVGMLNSFLDTDGKIDIEHFVTPYEQSVAGTAQNQLKFELHSAANPALFSSKKLNLTITSYARSVDYKQIMLVTNETEFYNAINDINQTLPNPYIVLGADLVLTKNYTVSNPFTFNLNGNKIIFNTNTITLSHNGQVKLYSLRLVQTITQLSIGSGGFVLNAPQGYLNIESIVDANNNQMGRVYAQAVTLVNFDQQSAELLYNSSFNQVFARGIMQDTQVYPFGNNYFYNLSATFSGATYANGILSVPQTDKTVVLNANVLGENFAYKVIGSGDGALSAVLDLLKHIPVQIEDVFTNISYDLYLPTSVPEYNASIWWQTSNASLMSANGKIGSELSGRVHVVLTAHIKINNKSYIEEFKFRVYNIDNDTQLLSLLNKIGTITLKDVTDQYNCHNHVHLPSANSLSEFYYRNPYAKDSPEDTEGQMGQWSWGGFEDIGLKTIEYQSKTEYDFISVYGGNHVYLNQAVIFSFAQIDVFATFFDDTDEQGNDIVYQKTINIVIEFGTFTHLFNPILDAVETYFENIDILENILTTRKNYGMANEAGDFILPAKFDGGFEVSYTSPSPIFSEEEILGNENFKNIKVNAEYFDQIILSVRLTINVRNANLGITTTPYQRNISLEVPAAIHKDKQGFESQDVFNSVKYQVWQQLPNDEKFNDNNASGFEITNSNTIIHYNTVKNYILLRDLDFAQTLSFKRQEDNALMQLLLWATSPNKNVAASTITGGSYIGSTNVSNGLEMISKDEEAAIRSYVTSSTNVGGLGQSLAAFNALWSANTYKLWHDDNQQFPSYIVTDTVALNEEMRKVSNNYTFKESNMYYKFIELLFWALDVKDYPNDDAPKIKHPGGPPNTGGPLSSWTTKAGTPLSTRANSNGTNIQSTITFYNSTDGKPFDLYFEATEDAKPTISFIEYLTIEDFFFYFGTSGNKKMYYIHGDVSSYQWYVSDTNGNRTSTPVDLTTRTATNAALTKWREYVVQPTYFSQEGLLNIYNGIVSNVQTTQHYTTNLSKGETDNTQVNYGEVASLDGGLNGLTYFKELKHLYIYSPTRANKGIFPLFSSQYNFDLFYNNIKVYNKWLETLVLQNSIINGFAKSELLGLSVFEDLVHLDLKNNNGIDNIGQIVGLKNPGNLTYLDVAGIDIQFEYNDMSLAFLYHIYKDKNSNIAPTINYTNILFEDKTYTNSTVGDAKNAQELLASLDEIGALSGDYLQLVTKLYDVSGSYDVSWRLESGNHIEEISAYSSYNTISTAEEMLFKTMPYFLWRQATNVDYTLYKMAATGSTHTSLVTVSATFITSLTSSSTTNGTTYHYYTGNSNATASKYSIVKLVISGSGSNRVRVFTEYVSHMSYGSQNNLKIAQDTSGSTTNRDNLVNNFRNEASKYFYYTGNSGDYYVNRQQSNVLISLTNKQSYQLLRSGQDYSYAQAYDGQNSLIDLLRLAKDYQIGTYIYYSGATNTGGENAFDDKFDLVGFKLTQNNIYRLHKNAQGKFTLILAQANPTNAQVLNSYSEFLATLQNAQDYMLGSKYFYTGDFTATSIINGSNYYMPQLNLATNTTYKLIKNGSNKYSYVIDSSSYYVGSNISSGTNMQTVLSGATADMIGRYYFYTGSNSSNYNWSYTNYEYSGNFVKDSGYRLIKKSNGKYSFVLDSGNTIITSSTAMVNLLASATESDIDKYYYYTGTTVTVANTKNYLNLKFVQYKAYVIKKIAGKYTFVQGDIYLVGEQKNINNFMLLPREEAYAVKIGGIVKLIEGGDGFKWTYKVGDIYELDFDASTGVYYMKSFGAAKITQDQSQTGLRLKNLRYSTDGTNYGGRGGTQTVVLSASITDSSGNVYTRRFIVDIIG